MSRFKMILVILACLVSSQIPAAETNEIDLDNLLAEKKAMIEENLPLNQQEKQAFWSLYDEYMKDVVKLFKRRTLLSRRFMKLQENFNDKQAKEIIEEHFKIVDESVKVQKSMLARLRKKLPEKKVIRFFQIELKTEAGLFYFLSENIPLIK